MTGTVAELCCGAGGMAQGFSPYFDIVHAIDIKSEVVQTYGANHPETNVRKQDIRLLTGCRGDFDGITGVIGGPPCQGSSIINTKRCADDPRNLLKPSRNQSEGIMQIIYEPRGRAPEYLKAAGIVMT